MRLIVDLALTLLAVAGVLTAYAALRTAQDARRSSAPAKFRELEADARSLIEQFASEFDKLHMMLARNARRQQREAQRLREAEEAAQPTEVPDGSAAPSHPDAGNNGQPDVRTRASWKAQRYASMGLLRR